MKLPPNVAATPVGSKTRAAASASAIALAHRARPRQEMNIRTRPAAADRGLSDSLSSNFP